jgi:hypothetical protein
MGGQRGLPLLHMPFRPRLTGHASSEGQLKQYVSKLDRTMPSKTARRRRKKGEAGPAVIDHWAILTFSARLGSNGFYLDSVVDGKQEDAELEAEAARQSAASGSYSTVFVVPITAGGGSLTAPIRKDRGKPKYDVWLFRRDANGFREYEVKLVKHPHVPPGSKKAGGAASAPDQELDQPESPGEEWQAICLERRWMRFQLP